MGTWSTSRRMSAIISVSLRCVFRSVRKRIKKKRKRRGVDLLRGFVLARFRWTWWVRACTNTVTRAITRSCGNACPRSHPRTTTSARAVSSCDSSARWPAKEGRSIWKAPPTRLETARGFLETKKPSGKLGRLCLTRSTRTKGSRERHSSITQRVFHFVFSGDSLYR